MAFLHRGVPDGRDDTRLDSTGLSASAGAHKGDETTRVPGLSETFDQAIH